MADHATPLPRISRSAIRDKLDQNNIHERMLFPRAAGTLRLVEAVLRAGMTRDGAES